MSAIRGLHYKFRKLFPNEQTYLEVHEFEMFCVIRALPIHIMENANGQRLIAKANKSPLTGGGAGVGNTKGGGIFPPPY